MQLTPKQASAVDAFRRWYPEAGRARPQAFRVFGYAGTGKTELAKHFASGIHGEVYFGALTGKAAHVLHQRGCPNATTLHKLCYTPKDKSADRLRKLESSLRDARQLPEDHPDKRMRVSNLEAAVRAERENLSRPFFQLNLESPLKSAKLLVVDECSMVDEQLGADLLSFGCPVLALGDPGQLPPVYGRPHFRGEPEVMLEEIHRQARDNPIIHLATLAREGRDLPLGPHGTSRVVSQRDIGKDGLREAVLWADQVLVGRNATRSSYNARIRQLRGHQSPLPVTQDKLVCLRNNHEVGLLNGQVWTCRTDCVEVDEVAVGLDLDGETGGRAQVAAHRAPFLGRKVDLHVRRDAEEFDYGYALTVHKFQGSSAPKVTLYDEWGASDRAKWLYTGITRAQESVVVVGA